MRIKSGDADVWILDAELEACIVDKFSNLDDTRLLAKVTGLAKGNVCRNVNHAQWSIGQEHGVLLGAGEGGVNLGMAVIVVACLMEGFLV